ncbi:response regulator [Hydrogenophaga sp. RAC07]|uniref:response regulator n=1 Tax=Hydrogenophaga sp. RAC07 TaxID=1842537 RepID=UPI00083D3EA1|nr:response regulator [Hydrogenophaga sp. RAC07]AOF86138.1 response regulator [Hydrogenophaga sp. RAC07]
MNTHHHVQRVVLIDDSENDNFFHEIALRKAGFGGEVRIFESGESALDFLLQDRVSVPTVVFLDINMPGMNGFEVARALSDQLRPQAELQLNMLTSSAWSVDKATAESIGLIQHYLVKPLTPDMAADLIGQPESVRQAQ